MCGIFGYVGHAQNAADLVLRGLKKLEYRGYDSWGVAVGHRDQVVLAKRTGKIGDAAPDLPASAIGIGHTRWATHGGVTEPNAHPHLDCTGRLALIHNGIVSNYRELREPLLAAAIWPVRTSATAMALSPCRRRKAVIVALTSCSGPAGVAARHSSIRCATTSVSVSERKR
jgi:glutamine phosphoribosylpyrophosphate amidotransferase